MLVILSRIVDKGIVLIALRLLDESLGSIGESMHVVFNFLADHDIVNGDSYFLRMLHEEEKDCSGKNSEDDSKKHEKPLPFVIECAEQALT